MCVYNGPMIMYISESYNVSNTFYEKMTIYKLKEVLDSQYNRSDVKRHHRSVLFLIQNTVTGNQSLYEIDRIAKHSAALRCIEKKCRARLSFF